MEITSGSETSIEAYWNKGIRERRMSGEEEEERERAMEEGNHPGSEEKAADRPSVGIGPRR